MLAGFLVKHPCELRADFQRVYGLNLDDMGESYTYRHAADLAVMLPRDSLVFLAEHPELEWSDRDYFLWSIEYSLRVLKWQNTKDGQKGNNQPRPIPTPADTARIRAKVDNTDLNYIAEQLGIDL
ncbi:MAG TPA: hypothetical protein DCP91_05700 [Eggerthellaceae bacterium]|nr:hypothetical protein [Eggerthellaceae bacterium]